MNKYIKTPIGLMIIALLSLPVIVYGINSLSDGYKVANIAKEIEVHGNCRTVLANDGREYFVPTRTSSEWDEFLDKHPGGLTIAECNSCEYSPQGSPIETYIFDTSTESCFDSGGSSDCSIDTEIEIYWDNVFINASDSGITLPFVIGKYKYDIGEYIAADSQGSGDDYDYFYETCRTNIECEYGFSPGYYIEEYTDGCSLVDDNGNCDDTQEDLLVLWNGESLDIDSEGWPGPTIIDGYVYTQGEVMFQETTPNNAGIGGQDNEQVFYEICRDAI